MIFMTSPSLDHQEASLFIRQVHGFLESELFEDNCSLTFLSTHWIMLIRHLVKSYSDVQMLK